MARTERTLTPILVTQAMTLVLTTGVAIAWTTTELRDWRSQVEVPQQTMRDIESHVQEAIIAPFNFVGTRNPTAAISAQKSTAEALASLKILGNLVPELQTHTEAARSALEILDDASAGLWDGHAAVADADADIQTTDAVLPSLALLEEAKDGVDVSLSTLSKKVASHASNHQLSNRIGILGLWTGALAIYLLTGFTARRRFMLNETTKKTELTHAIDGAVEALQAATSGKPVPTIPDHPMVAEFKSTIRSVATRLEDLHQTNRRIRRQFTFRHELVDALDLAESENEVIRTATRAARVAFPEKIFQLLVARPDEGTIEPIDTAAPVACTLACIESCPAARKGDVLYHHPDMGLSRCPRIRDEDTIVTCAPISVNGQAVGVVQLMGTPLEDGQEELLEALSTAVGVRTGVVRNLAERELAAGTDPLTELANRRAMDEHMRRLDGAEVPYTVIVADLDHFKQINDNHGHDVGDRCLQLFADILKEACRDTDIACRPGGEEFSLILSGAGTDAGMAVASRIRAMLAQETRRQGPVFTVSIGIAARPIHGDRAEEILRSADVALYDAKDQGRDRCVLAEMPMSLEVVG